MLIEVVGGIVVKDGRLLLTQRRANQDSAFSWECPGGKVEGNESNHDALRRELREELGIAVDGIPETAVWSGSWPPTVDRGREIFLLLYMVRSYRGEPRPLEGQGMGWFTLEEADRLTLNGGLRKGFGDVARAIAYLKILGGLQSGGNV